MHFPKQKCIISVSDRSLFPVIRCIVYVIDILCCSLLALPRACFINSATAFSCPAVTCCSDSIIPFPPTRNILLLSAAYLNSFHLQGSAWILGNYAISRFQLRLIPSPFQSHIMSAVKRQYGLSAWALKLDGLDLDASTLFTILVTSSSYLMYLCLFPHL